MRMPLCVFGEVGGLKQWNELFELLGNLLIKHFRDKHTEDLFSSGQGNKKWRSFQRTARKKLVFLDAATSLHDLKAPPNNQLEALRDDRRGQYSIRINDQYRVFFEWRNGHAYNVEIDKPRGH